MRSKILHLVSVTVALTCLCLAELVEVSPNLTANLPEPPHQADPWAVPVSKIPPEFVEAVQLLFRQGFADPRGGSYREIRVVTGDCAGTTSIDSSHGWLLPREAGCDTLFAVCWNGLVYPVVEVGEETDIRSDMELLLRKEQERRDEHTRSGPGHRFWRNLDATMEGPSIAEGFFLPGKICMLLRIGEVDLAERLWEEWSTGLPPDATDPAYVLLATDFLWARFDRGLCAHMRGDDRLALADFRWLTTSGKAVAEEAEKRSLGILHYELGRTPIPDFLRQLPELLADQERRANEREQESAITEADSKSDGLDSLIRNLDQYRGTELNLDWRFRDALIREGANAVKPLLTCLESDSRMTRAVGYDRPWFYNRKCLSVGEISYDVLCEIVGIDRRGGNKFNSAEARQTAALAIREHWNKSRQPKALR